MSSSNRLLLTCNLEVTGKRGTENRKRSSKLLWFFGIGRQIVSIMLSPVLVHDMYSSAHKIMAMNRIPSDYDTKRLSQGKRETFREKQTDRTE